MRSGGLNKGAVRLRDCRGGSVFGVCGGAIERNRACGPGPSRPVTEILPRTLQSEAGYIDARPKSRQIDETLLRRTVGTIQAGQNEPSKHVRCSGSFRRKRASPPPHVGVTEQYAVPAQAGRPTWAHRGGQQARSKHEPRASVRGPGGIVPIPYGAASS
jgi:hypothetical protein